jgi:F-type H+-transporting ATPase subunit epsilon
MPNLYVEIVSPDNLVFQGEAQGVQAPGVEGSFEVLFNHAPMIAAFGIGELRVTTASGEQIFFATSGGFMEVIDNHVNVMAETAEPASAIDVSRARASEARALERLKAAQGESERRSAERDLERARNRLRTTMGHVGSRLDV